jgi:hypothetical protein
VGTSRKATGSVLDAGATTNYRHLLDCLLDPIDELVRATLAPGGPAASGSISYVRADLGKLPFWDALFETVVCVSTLEHIGLDNSRWGVVESRADDPEQTDAPPFRNCAV